MYNQLPQYCIQPALNFYDFNVFSFIMLSDQQFGYSGLTDNQKGAMFRLWGEYLGTPNGFAAQAQPQLISQSFYNYLLSNKSRLMELASQPQQPIATPFPAQQMGYVQAPPLQQFPQPGQFQSPAMYSVQTPINPVFQQPPPQPLPPPQQFGGTTPSFNHQPQIQQQVFSEHNTGNPQMETEWSSSMFHMISLFESRKGKLDSNEVYAVITAAERTNCVTQNNPSLYSNAYVNRIDTQFKVIGLFVINKPFDHTAFGWKKNGKAVWIIYYKSIPRSTLQLRLYDPHLSDATYPSGKVLIIIFNNFDTQQILPVATLSPLLQQTSPATAKTQAQVSTNTTQKDEDPSSTINCESESKPFNIERDEDKVQLSTYAESIKRDISKWTFVYGVIEKSKPNNPLRERAVIRLLYKVTYTGRAATAKKAEEEALKHAGANEKIRFDSHNLAMRLFRDRNRKLCGTYEFPKVDTEPTDGGYDSKITILSKYTVRNENFDGAYKDLSGKKHIIEQLIQSKQMNTG